MAGWANWLPRGRSLSFAGACARLGLALTLFALPVAALTFQRLGWAGATATAVAAGVCGMGGGLALAVAAWGRRVAGPQQALWALLGGFVFRMLLPLSAGFALDRQVPQLKAAGIFGLIVVFYLFTLVMETWLSLLLSGPGDRPAGRDGAAAATGSPSGEMGISGADRLRGAS